MVKALDPLRLNDDGLPPVDAETGRTGVPWLFCGGDLAGVAQTTVESVNDGKTAAWAMHRYVQVGVTDRLIGLSAAIGFQGAGSTRKTTQSPKTVSGSGISWAICKSVCTSLQTDNHASTQPLSFLQAGCPSCCPTNSIKALKAYRVLVRYLSGLDSGRLKELCIRWGRWGQIPRGKIARLWV